MEFVPSGLFDGVMTTFGVYEECINIESPMAKWNDIRGKYCLGKVHLPILNPSFPTNEELEYESKETSSSPMDLSNINSNVIKKFLFSRLNLDFDEMNNKLKLLQMINVFNGSYYRIGLCFPSTCSSFELERAINKCKSLSRDYFSSFRQQNRMILVHTDTHTLTAENDIRGLCMLSTISIPPNT